MAARRNRTLSWLLVSAALLVASQMVHGQTGMTGGGTGTGGTGGGTGTGSTGGSTGSGGTGGAPSTGGGTNGEFLGTGIDNTFIEGGYDPGALGHAGKAGNRGPTANTTLFGRFYVNALGLGLPQGTGATAIVAFGTPLYSSLYSGTGTTGTTGATGSVGTGRLSGGATTGLGGGVGSITAGFTPMNTNANTYRRPASYTTSIAFKYRPTPQAEVHSNLRQMLARSSDLAGNDSLEVLMDGQTVVVRGTVAEFQQSRLAENLLRLSPGVRNVRNEIQVQETAPPPKPLNP